MKKQILLIGLVIAGALGIIAYSQYNKKVESVEKMEIEVEITAEDLLNNYDENEANSNTMYLDKVILVTGKVADVKIDENKKSIFLETGNDLSNIICQLEDSTQDLPSIGETVKIKGICTGFLMDVVIVRAIIQ